MLTKDINMVMYSIVFVVLFVVMVEFTISLASLFSSALSARYFVHEPDCFTSCPKAVSVYDLLAWSGYGCSLIMSNIIILSINISVSVAWAAFISLSQTTISFSKRFKIMSMLFLSPVSSMLSVVFNHLSVYSVALCFALASRCRFVRQDKVPLSICPALAANRQMFMTVCSTRKTTANWHKHGVICWPVILIN